MKKLASFVLALAMAAVCAAPAMADNNQITQESDPKSCDTTVTFTIAPSYTVTIPAATKVINVQIKTVLTLPSCVQCAESQSINTKAPPA